MINKDQIVASMMFECDVAKHLHGKLTPQAYDYKPTAGQRTTLELLRYLSICGIAGIRSLYESNWKEFGKYVERSAKMKAEEFPAAMDLQKKELKEFFDSVTERVLETRDAGLPIGGTQLLGQAILDLPFKWLAAYKLQLFLYAKATCRCAAEFSNFGANVNHPPRKLIRTATPGRFLDAPGKDLVSRRRLGERDPGDTSSRRTRLHQPLHEVAGGAGLRPQDHPLRSARSQIHSSRISDTVMFTTTAFRRRARFLARPPRLRQGSPHRSLLGHDSRAGVLPRASRARGESDTGERRARHTGVRKDAKHLVTTLPDSEQRTIRKREAEKKFDAPDYLRAVDDFYGRYVWRHPDSVNLDSMMKEANMDIYNYMQGPSEFAIVGTLKYYDATPF